MQFKELYPSMKKKYKLGIYEKAFPEHMSIFEMLMEAKYAGYDYLEMSIDRTDAKINRVYDINIQNQILSAIKEAEFPIESVCLSAHSLYCIGSEDPDIREKALDIFRHCLDFCLRLNIRLIQIAGYDVNKSDSSPLTRRYFDQNIRKMVEWASICGITLALENMDTEFIDTVLKATYWVKKINSPYMQIYPDSGNIMNASYLNRMSYIDDMKTGIGHYVAFHVKEARPGKYGGLFYGEGNVDFAQIIPMAYILGVRRFVMEFWCVDIKCWKTNLVEARHFFDNMISKYELYY